MSVVAGCLPFNGVLLAADTRITYTRTDETRLHVDHAQKILPFSPGTAIGFVGQVNTASALLQALITERDRRFLLPARRRRLDPTRLSLWIPRFLRAAFVRLPKSLQSSNVAFMVASSYEHEANIVDRQLVRNLLQKRLAHGAVVTSDLLFRLGWGIEGPATVAIPKSHRGLLYAVRPPLFAPVMCRPLSFMAIGEGFGAVGEVDSVEDSILADQTGTGWWDASLFRGSVSGYAERKGIASVGGLYPVLRVTGDSFQCIGHHTTKYRRGSREVEAVVELVVEGDRWVQRNPLSGESVPLKLPWELTETPNGSRLFDYLDKRRGDHQDSHH